MAVSPSGGGTTTPPTYLGVQPEGEYEISVTPASGFRFTGWSANPAANATFLNNSSDTGVTLHGNATVTANLVETKLASVASAQMKSSHSETVKCGVATSKDTCSLSAVVQLPSDFDLSAIEDSTYVRLVVGETDKLDKNALSCCDKWNIDKPTKGGFATFIVPDEGGKKATKTSKSGTGLVSWTAVGKK